MMKSHFHPFPRADVLFSCHFFCSTLVTHCLILSDSSNKPFPSIMWQFILSKLVRSPTHFYHVSTDVSESLNPYWHPVKGAGLGRKTWTCEIAFSNFIPQGQLLSFQISMLWAAHLGSLLFCLCTWSWYQIQRNWFSVCHRLSVLTYSGIYMVWSFVYLPF